MGKGIMFFIQLLAYGFYFLPRFVQLKLGQGLGRLLWTFQYRSQVVSENLARAYPHDLKKQQQILKATYQHLGNLFLEILLVVGPLKSFVQKYVTIIGMEHVVEAKKKGKGILFQVNHMGNWEVLLAALGVQLDCDLMMVTKSLKPAWFHEGMQKGRLRCGVKATYEPRTMRDIMNQLKKKGSVAMATDQYLGPPVGVRVPFFGIPVGTSILVATLAKRTQAEVLSTDMYRTPDGRFVVEIHPPLEWETHPAHPHYEIVKNTEKYAQFIEACVYRHPEQWLWTHRRFKGDLSPLLPEEWFQPRIRR